MASQRPFRVAFPEITLPANFGGKRAIVLMSMQRPTDPRLAFAVCMDIDGGVHQMVPVTLTELQQAALNPVHMIQIERQGETPLAGVSGLVDVSGRVL